MNDPSFNVDRDKPGLPRELPPTIAELAASAPPTELGHGTPSEAARSTLAALTVEIAFAGIEVIDRQMADAALAGLLLMHHCLEDSHERSQLLEDRAGAYWHGIMHRREGDFSNAKYWFRRVGAHPIHEPLATYAREITAGMKAASAAAMVALSIWNADRFVDLCEQAVAGHPPASFPPDAPERSARDERQLTSRDVCQRIQQRECELLLEHCCRQAIGA